MVVAFLRLRLLPATIVGILALTAVKAADVARGGRSLFISSVKAQQGEAGEAKPAEPSTAPAADASAPTPAAAAAPAEKPAEAAAEKPAEKPAEKAEDKPAEKPAEATAEKPAEKKEEGAPAKPEEKPAEKASEKVDEKSAPKTTEKHAEKLNSGEFHSAKEEEQTAEDSPAEIAARGLDPKTRVLSPIELDIIQNLFARRTQLESWHQDLEAKENLLTAVEKRVDEKITQIDEMKKELRELIATYSNEQDGKIKSLVKIYESMKPRDAARIFDEVEMPILLLVIDRMSEKKAAPILAAMTPEKAKQLTVELAEARRLQSLKLNKAAQAAAPPAKP